MTGRVVCFGEVLLRLSAPGKEFLLQSPQLEARFGGAEANVAVSLARFGHAVSVATVLPDNQLGRAALGELRRHGVGTGGVRFAPGRLGLYFLAPGAALRPSEIVYDRAGSAFALASPDLIDWDRELAGVDWLHLSGVTPAVSSAAAEAAVRAARAARRLGVRLSFDGNFRATLWADRAAEAPGLLRSLLECADLAFIDDRDIALVLGEAWGEPRSEGARARAAQAAFAAFPQLGRIASTLRVEHAVDDHDLSAVLQTRSGEQRARTFRLPGIVDRIGAGDAFAAGVLHGVMSGLDDAAGLDFGLAAACLKHAVPGDFNLVDTDGVKALLAGDGLHVRR